jgi:hypothetical protein
MSRYTLETIVVILVIMWLLGWLVVPVAGNLVHLLLVIILIVVLIRLLQGRRPLVRARAASLLLRPSGGQHFLAGVRPPPAMNFAPRALAACKKCHAY